MGGKAITGRRSHGSRGACRRARKAAPRRGKDRYGIVEIVELGSIDAHPLTVDVICPTFIYRQVVVNVYPEPKISISRVAEYQKRTRAIGSVVQRVSSVSAGPDCVVGEKDQRSVGG